MFKILFLTCNLNCESAMWMCMVLKTELMFKHYISSTILIRAESYYNLIFLSCDFDKCVFRYRNSIFVYIFLE